MTGAAAADVGWRWIRALMAMVIWALTLGVAQADVRVIDGDTLEIDGDRHRLFGIDAAERQQTCRAADQSAWNCAAAATAALRDLVSARDLRCSEVPGTRDGFGRTISRCKVGDQDVADVLTRAGLVWAFRRYSADYIDAENEARRKALGIWSVPSAGEPNETPWAWRARRRAENERRPQAEPADPGCRIKGNISQSGRVYHLPGTRDWAATRINENRGERWFCTEEQAIAAGWRAPRGN